MKNSKPKITKPRVNIPFNTGTKIMKSKKDKMNTRQALKKLLSSYPQD